MLNLLMSFVSIAVASISPIGVSIVVLLLSAERGVAKAVAYLSSTLFAFLVWGLISQNLSIHLVSREDSAPRPGSLLIRASLGIVFLMLAVRCLLTQQDPDAAPPKWKSTLDKAGVGTVVAISLAMGFTNLRFMLLMMVGTDTIASLQPNLLEAALGLALLLLAVTWPQLVPLGVYVAAGERSERALAKMDGWLTEKSHLINASIFGLIGIVLLLDVLQRAWSS